MDIINRREITVAVLKKLPATERIIHITAASGEVKNVGHETFDPASWQLW